MGTIRIALICFDNPFLRPMEGGKRAMMTKMRSLLLEPSQYEVDIYLHNKRTEGMASDYQGLEKLAHGIYQFPMNPSWKSVFGKYPICVNKRYHRQCAELLKGKTYDVAIYEGMQVAKYRLKNIVQARYHLVYMHDIESAYRAEVAKSQRNPLLCWMNQWESQRFRWMERQIKNKFDHVWFISKDECSAFGQWMGVPEKCEYMPFPALEIAQAPVYGEKAPRMLYVGDLSIQHNFSSLKWFASDVLPLIKKDCPQAELMVVGRISDERAAVLKKLGATVCGYVDDLDAAYDNAAFIIAPILFGAGVKVKIIDAIARGQIVVTTAKGIEGTDLQSGVHLFVEDHPDRLAAACCDILRNREPYVHLAEDGLAFIKARHTIAHQADIINHTIERLMQIGSDAGLQETASEIDG